MKLEKKNLFYSIAIAGILLIFLMGYFGGMLPALYVAYIEDQNLDSVIQQHREYMKQHSCQSLDSSYTNLCFTLDIPSDGNEILITSQLLQLSVTLHDTTLIATLDDVRNEVSKLSLQDGNLDGLETDYLKDKLKEWETSIETVWNREKNKQFISESPILIQILNSVFHDNTNDNRSGHVSEQLHLLPNSMLVYESKVQYGHNYYSNYLAMTAEGRSLVITYLPTITPRMNEITPIVLQSMPMLIAVTILIVLIFSVFYSRKIVHPITELEMFTRNANDQHTLLLPDVCKNSKDEIASLGNALHELYTKLHEQYNELEQKNKLLEEDNQRQEIFLKASSHQLKTPIAAALLLVDGMIEKIGKYKDTETYLPELKIQLLQMKKMTEDILYLRHCESNLSLETAPLDSIVTQCIQNHRLLIQEHGYDLEYKTDQVQPVITDVNLTFKILDNLILNAVTYAKEQTRLVIHVTQNKITIFNQGHIADDLLPHIFEPFVSGQKDSSCHGLGLYIASYYTKVLKADISIVNTIAPTDGPGVLATLCLPPAIHPSSLPEEG